MLRFELRHYMYPPYLSHALCHPSTGVPVCLFRFPGVPPLSRLHHRATIYRPSPGLNSLARLRLQNAKEMD